ncbi:MAG: CARDB domain-containing protein [Tepidiformaceae bacterium]
MSDRYSPYPPDEPVIGATYPTAPPLPPYPADGGYVSAPSYVDDTEEDGDWDEGEDDGYQDEYEDNYSESYYEDTPARQPMFYLFIALAALVGGIVIFLLFSFVNGGGGNEPKTAGAVKFNVAIQSPIKDKRIEIGKPEDVIVEASSTEPIVRFELFIQDKLADTVEVKDTSADNKYRANLKATFERKGEFNLYVKVTSASGATQQSDKLRVIAIEPVGDRPATINGKVVATVNLRTGPGENFEQVGTLTEGKIVKIIGRTANNEWLLVDMDGGRWVKASAIDPQDSLALVPIRQVTPTAVPATNTPQPSPSASPSPVPSPTANASAPDFAPTGAVAIDGGTRLRVTVGNRGAANYAGAVVVSVSGVGPGTLTQAFNMNLPAGGSAVADFELNPPLSSGRTAVVKVDPENALKETNEDNNSASFSIAAPAVEQPQIAIQSPSVTGSAVGVVIVNNGGTIENADVTVRVRLNDAQTSQTQKLTLAKGQTATFSVTRPQGTGQATIEVVVGGVVLATTTVQLTA